MIFSQNNNYIGITLFEDALKLVHLRVSASEKKILNVYRKPIQGVAEEEIPKIISVAMNELGAKKSNAVYIMPANIATTKNIEIPSLDPNEIKSIIDLQAGRHTPYSREEILLGYVTIGEHQRNYTQVLLIIVNRNVIKKQLEYFEQVGIKIQKVLFAPEGMARFYSKILNLKMDDPPIGIIDIEKKSTEFIIAYRQSIVTCRNIPLGMENLLKEGNETKEKLISELTSSVEAYQSEGINKLPEAYYLTSDDTKIKDLEPRLREKLKANIKIVPLLDHMKADQPIMLKLVSEFNDDSFLDIVSSVSGANEAQVDLLPDEIKQQRTIEDQAKQLVKAGSYAIIILLLICGVFFSQIYFRSIYLKKVEAEYDDKRNQVEKLDQIAQNTRIIKEFLNSRMVSLNVINELYQFIPEEIYLKSMLLDEDGTISIEGTSDTMSLVFNLVSALENSMLFKEVKTKSTTAKKERGKDVAAFEITFRLESAPDEEEEKVEPPTAETVTAPVPEAQ